MRISANILRRYVSGLPTDLVSIRDLLEDVGIEVKRILIEEEDIRFDVELLANRGDHRCYAGIAREIFARVGGNLRAVPVNKIQIEEGGGHAEVETDLCYVYALARFEVVDPCRQLGSESVEILRVAGVGLSHPIVDATNVANLEVGQPLHAFDADRIQGTIRVRESRPGETAWPLFADKAIGVPGGTVVIADDAKILAIAGVIGCKEASVSETTRRVIVESAAFDPIAVRKASKALSIITDASQRFERGSDPSAVPRGIERFAKLVADSGIARPLGPGSVRTSRRTFTTNIAFSMDQLHDFFGTEFQKESVLERLSRLGYVVQSRSDGSIEVETPTFRYWDVHNRWDVFEDIARVLSYSSIPEEQPAVSMGAEPTNEEQTVASIRSYLVSQGFFEVFTDAFYGPATREALTPDRNHALWPHVNIANAIDKGYSLLKNNCLAQALEAVAHNLRFGQPEIRLFEIGRTFHKDQSSDNGVCFERQMCWGIMVGDATAERWQHRAPTNYWHVKGLMEGLPIAIRRPLRICDETPSNELCDLLHPLRSGLIRIDGREVGLFGEIHPLVLGRFDIKRARPLYFQFYLNEWIDTPPVLPTAKEPSLRPPSVRALSFVLADKVEAESIRAAILEFGPDWLEDVAVVDVFQIAKAADGPRSVTYQLSFENDRSDHTAQEISIELEAVVTKVEALFAPAGVKLRR